MSQHKKAQCLTRSTSLRFLYDASSPGQHGSNTRCNLLSLTGTFRRSFLRIGSHGKGQGREEDGLVKRNAHFGGFQQAKQKVNECRLFKEWVDTKIMDRKGPLGWALAGIYTYGNLSVVMRKVQLSDIL